MAEFNSVCVHRIAGRNFAVEEPLRRNGYRIAAYVQDDPAPENPSDAIPIVTTREWKAAFRALPSICTALDPSIRRGTITQIESDGGAVLNLHPASFAISGQARISTNSLFADGLIYVGPFVTIGAHTIIMAPVSIGHDACIGRFVTLFPGVAISGNVIVEDDVTIESGAIITNGTPAHPLTIGHHATIRIGAVVTRDVRPGTVIAGNPGSPISP